MQERSSQKVVRELLQKWKKTIARAHARMQQQLQDASLSHKAKSRSSPKNDVALWAWSDGWELQAAIGRGVDAKGI